MRPDCAPKGSRSSTDECVGRNLPASRSAHPDAATCIGAAVQTSRQRRSLVPLAIAGALMMTAPALASMVAEPPLTATPQGECGPGSNPETGLQGRVSREDMESGRAGEGYTCNTEMVGSFTSAVLPLGTFGSIAGFKVHRYVDAAGHECAYYDSSLMFPTNVADQEAGVVVLDMADPANPVSTATLRTPGMLQMHESLVMSEERGILAAVTAIVATTQGILDIYDLTEDCRNPTLISTTPLPVLAHESGLSPDGNVFWAASTATDYIFAVDISDPLLPSVIYVSDFGSHGINVGNDGTRTYLSQSGNGMTILDTSEVQAYVGQAGSPIVDPGVLPELPGALLGGGAAGTPEVTQVAHLDWTSRSIPQNSVPFTSNGGKFLMEVDEYGGCGSVGAARIIDINDETNPFVLSNLRLEVHNPENFDEICGDPGARNPIQGYGAHYCHIPTRVDPTIVACSMIISGLRIFDITDVANPVEVAYFNAPVQPRPVFDAIPEEFGSPVTFERRTGP